MQQLEETATHYPENNSTPDGLCRGRHDAVINKHHSTSPSANLVVRAEAGRAEGVGPASPLAAP